MAVEKPLSAGAEGQALVGLGADPWPPSSPPPPGAARTPSPGWGSWSGPPAASPCPPRAPHHQPAFPDGPQDPEAPSLKPTRRFLPPSWKEAFGRRWWRWPREGPLPSAPSSGPPTPPPVNPGLEGPERPSWAGEDGSTGSERKEGGEDPPSDATTSATPAKSLASATSHSGASPAPPGYQEKLEAYGQRYGYLRSWPGLLRLLGGLELVLGGMAFTCAASSIQKDYQWPQVYGNSLTGADFGYYVPMTPFVLVVASLVWLLTVILLALGLTMHYRAILLHSHWWPLAEFALNLSMFLLYLAAAIAYVHDVNRGGLCYSAFAYGPLLTALCRVDGGQVAALTFLFLAPLLYLMGSLVCLRMWRHEAARRMLRPPRPVLLPGAPPGPLGTPPAKARPAGRGSSKRVVFSEEGGPEGLSSAIPVGHHPKPLIVPDYIVRYPAIGSPAERQKYTAVFKDQYSEYQALFRQIQAARQRFKELEAGMSRLPAHPQNQQEQSRVSALWRAYRGKKKDPSFLERQERCAYLRRKLSHLKAQIQTFDADRSEPSMML